MFGGLGSSQNGISKLLCDSVQTTVTDIMCSGRVRVSLKPLMDDLPIVAAVQVRNSYLKESVFISMSGAKSLFDNVAGGPVSCWLYRALDVPSKISVLIGKVCKNLYIS